MVNFTVTHQFTRSCKLQRETFNYSYQSSPFRQIQTPFRGLFCWNALLLIGALIKIQTIKLIRRQLGFSFYHLFPVYFSFCTFHDIFATFLSDRDGQRWSFVALNTVFSFYKNKKVLSTWHLLSTWNFGDTLLSDFGTCVSHMSHESPNSRDFTNWNFGELRYSQLLRRQFNIYVIKS